MAGKVKHAARSRKTYRQGIQNARRFLTDAMPLWLRQMLKHTY